MSLGVYTECSTLWRLDELIKIVDDLENRVVDQIHKNQIKVGRDYLHIVLQTFGKSAMTMREIVCLVTFGYPDGALALARNIYEQFISLIFFETHKGDSDFEDYVNDYFVDYRLQTNRALKYEAEHFKNEEKLKQLAEELNTVKRLAKHKISGGDYWWTGLGSFFKVAEEIKNVEKDPLYQQFFGRLYFAYKRACVAIHASGLGNSLRLGTDCPYPVIDNAPKRRGHELPLYLAVCSLIVIASVTCREIGLEEKYMNKELNDLAAFYFESLNKTN